MIQGPSGVLPALIRTAADGGICCSPEGCLSAGFPSFLCRSTRHAGSRTILSGPMGSIWNASRSAPASGPKASRSLSDGHDQPSLPRISELTSPMSREQSSSSILSNMMPFPLGRIFLISEWFLSHPPFCQALIVLQQQSLVSPGRSPKMAASAASSENSSLLSVSTVPNTLRMPPAPPGARLASPSPASAHAGVFSASGVNGNLEATSQGKAIFQPGQVAACTAMPGPEIAHRDRTKRARLLRQARFPVPKALDGFDWPDVAFPDGWGRDEMCSLAFVRDAEDLVSCGQTGRGKTHMATALGIAATSAGYPVRFFQTAQLVLQLGKAKMEGTLDRLLANIARARLPVLDELGYVPFDVDGARLLCQVISESYERRSVIFTTNVEFSRWGTVFADDKLAAAIVDRLCEASHKRSYAKHCIMRSQREGTQARGPMRLRRLCIMCIAV